MLNNIAATYSFISTSTLPPVSGYALWLDASDASTFTYSSGTRVSQWNDKSSNGYHFSNSNTGSQPNRNATQNGLSAVTMYASSTAYYLTNSSYDWPASAFTVLTVCRFNVPNYPALIGRNSTAALAIGGGQGSPLPLAISRIGQATSSSNLTQANTTTSQITYKSAGISSGSVTVQIYQNETAANSTVTVSSLVSGNKAIIGASTDGAADYFGTDGYICEILIYPSQLSDADRGSVETYLRNKWGV